MNQSIQLFNSVIIDKENADVPIVRKRNRLSLQNKKDVVNNFYQFLNDASDSDIRVIAKDLAIKAL
jgi:hypothetical protein